MVKICYLASGIMNAVRFFDPEVILLAGGMCAAGDTLMEPLKEKFKEISWQILPTNPETIRFAKLGADTGAVGAAAMALGVGGNGFLFCEHFEILKLFQICNGSSNVLGAILHKLSRSFKKFFNSTFFPTKIIISICSQIGNGAVDVREKKNKRSRSDSDEVISFLSS